METSATRRPLVVLVLISAALAIALAAAFTVPSANAQLICSENDVIPGVLAKCPAPPAPSPTPEPPTVAVVRTAPIDPGGSGPVQCLPGEHATGGGYRSVSGTGLTFSDLPTTNGDPSVAGETPNGWLVTVQGGGGGSDTVYVICES